MIEKRKAYQKAYRKAYRQSDKFKASQKAIYLKIKKYKQKFMGDNAMKIIKSELEKEDDNEKQKFTNI